ncbi:MAG: hypothetical protein M5R42_10800 [Rhodocyclaceae bacterium]|nr:hypothetical protein [Rhodocyclaceae bacterium]
MTRKLALLLPVLVLCACATPDKAPPPAAEAPCPRQLRQRRLSWPSQPGPAPSRCGRST